MEHLAAAALLAALTTTPSTGAAALKAPLEIYTCHNAHTAGAVCIGTDHGRPAQLVVTGNDPRLRGHQVFWVSRRFPDENACLHAIGMLRPHLESALYDMEASAGRGHLAGAGTANAAQTLTTPEAKRLTSACRAAMPSRGRALDSAKDAIDTGRTARTSIQLASAIRTLRTALGFPPDESRVS